MTTESTRIRSHRRVTFVPLALFLVAALVALPVARGHGEGEALFEGAERVIVPTVDNPPLIDGVVDEGEYSPYGTWGEEGEEFTLSLAHNDSWFFVAARQPGTGWIGVAFSSDVDEGANVVTATLNSSGMFVQDNFAVNVTDEMEMESDDSLAGSIDIFAFAATSSGTAATYEFAIPLESEDPYDQHLELGALTPFVAAFNATAQELPTALGEGDQHYLLAYVARASDDLAAIQELFEANPSPVGPLLAMAVLTTGVGAIVWLYGSPRKQEAT